MHAAAVIGEERLGHESDRFVVPLRHVAHDVFVILHVVGHLLHRREPNVDLGLARGRDFVMLALDRDARLLQLETHFIANVLQGVGRRDRKISFLCANLVTEIREFFARAVPMRLRRFRRDERRNFPGNEKRTSSKMKNSASGPKNRGVGDASAFQISLRFFGDTARVAIVRLARDRIDDGADQ